MISVLPGHGHQLTSGEDEEEDDQHRFMWVSLGNDLYHCCLLSVKFREAWKIWYSYILRQRGYEFGYTHTAAQT